MSGPPAVSVVVCTRDRARRLEALLNSLLRQTLDLRRFEVVVVDDASSDATSTVLRRWQTGGELELRPVTGHGTGIAGARNLGWRAARSPLVAFTDDDCEVSPGWLAEGLRAAERSPGAIVQGRTLPNPAEAGRSGPFTRTQRVDRSGPFYQTCNIFYPREALVALDGFDPAFRQAGEDTDLAWRAIERGVPVHFAPQAIAYHAIEDLGALGHLRVATRWSDAVENFGLHPGLRGAVLRYGVFWKRSHALLCLAVAGLLLAGQIKPAAALALPYVRHAVARCRSTGASPLLAAYYAVHDAVEVFAAVRGGLRRRRLVI